MMKYRLKVQKPEIVEAEPTNYWVKTLGVYMPREEFEKLYEPIAEPTSPQGPFKVEFNYSSGGWGPSISVDGVYETVEEAESLIRACMGVARENNTRDKWRIVKA